MNAWIYCGKCHCRSTTAKCLPIGQLTDLQISNTNTYLQIFQNCNYFFINEYFGRKSTLIIMFKSVWIDTELFTLSCFTFRIDCNVNTSGWGNVRIRLDHSNPSPVLLTGFGWYQILRLVSAISILKMGLITFKRKSVVLFTPNISWQSVSCIL